MGRQFLVVLSYGAENLDTSLRYDFFVFEGDPYVMEDYAFVLAVMYLLLLANAHAL